ncbi:MAG: hypothetical protein AB7Q81_24265 [Gammaproteobacteria bacterium]
MEPRGLVSFHCARLGGGCGHRWQGEPGRVEAREELDHHPFEYFAECPDCGQEAAQAAWERALAKAWTRATGPRTAEGKAASARNLDGHPTAEEAFRTRFNAMKHGLFARTATYFPAKPGKYPQCDGCELLVECHSQVACLKRTELFLKHQVAFETRDPVLLTDIRADTQAAVQALINDMIVAIAADGGPRLRTPEWYYDKDGGFHLAQWVDDKTGETIQLYKLEAHPLMKLLMDFISKNAMTLADMEMTPKAQDEQELMRGFLEEKRGEDERALDYQQRQVTALEDLREAITRSQEKTKRDPVLIEHGEIEVR